MSRGKRLLFTGLYVILALFIIFQIMGQRKIITRIEAEKERQEKVLREKEEENRLLKEILEKMNTGEFIEKEARERFNMIKDGDIPVNDLKQP